VPSSVLDASALLAYLQGEAGSEEVRDAIGEGAAISAANWAEVLSKLIEAGEDAVAGTAKGAEAPESYFCPYCAVTAPSDAWLTKAQVAVVDEVIQREFIDPELDKLQRGIDRLNRSRGGLIGIEARLERDEPEPVPELDETDDMRRVDFTCHPTEPVKVLDDWGRAVYCLICGEPALT